MGQAMSVSHLLPPTRHSKGGFSSYVPVSMSSQVQGIWLNLTMSCFQHLEDRVYQLRKFEEVGIVWLSELTVKLEADDFVGIGLHINICLGKRCLYISYDQHMNDIQKKADLESLRSCSKELPRKISRTQNKEYEVSLRWIKDCVALHWELLMKNSKIGKFINNSW